MSLPRFSAYFFEELSGFELEEIRESSIVFSADEEKSPISQVRGNLLFGLALVTAVLKVLIEFIIHYTRRNLIIYKIEAEGRSESYPDVARDLMFLKKKRTPGIFRYPLT